MSDDVISGGIPAKKGAAVPAIQSMSSLQILTIAMAVRQNSLGSFCPMWTPHHTLAG